MIKLKNLPPEYAHSLIGRSIFALYLQDRGVLSTGELNFFAERYNNRYRRYTDLLISYEDTYDFFEFLHTRFNGDMFPITVEEKNLVDREHLAILHELFTVDRQAGGQMLFFWAYNFKFIPIELISSIYEEFLHQEEEDKNGAYYTPPMLVDFVLNVTIMVAHVVKILLANSKRWLGSSITQWVLRLQNESDELARVAVPQSRPQSERH